MKVKELIEKLQEMDQEAVVNCYDGYDPYFGDKWSVCSSVEREATGWDHNNGCPIFEVFTNERISHRRRMGVVFEAAKRKA